MGIFRGDRQVATGPVDYVLGALVLVYARWGYKSEFKIMKLASSMDRRSRQNMTGHDIDVVWGTRHHI